MYWPPSQHFKEQWITQQYNSSLCQCWRIGLHFNRLDLFAVMLVWLGFGTQYHWNTNNNAKLKMSFKLRLCLQNLPIYLFKLLNCYWQCACMCTVCTVSVHVCVYTCLFLLSSTSVTSSVQQHLKWNMDDVLPQTRRGTHNHWQWQTSWWTTLSQWGRDTFARLSQAAKLTSPRKTGFWSMSAVFQASQPSEAVLQSYSVLCAYSSNVVIVNPNSRGVHYKTVNLQETTVPYLVITLMSQILCSYTLSVLVWFPYL